MGSRLSFLFWDRMRSPSADLEQLTHSTGTRRGTLLLLYLPSPPSTSCLYKVTGITLEWPCLHQNSEKGHGLEQAISISRQKNSIFCMSSRKKSLENINLTVSHIRLMERIILNIQQLNGHQKNMDNIYQNNYATTPISPI